MAGLLEHATLLVLKKGGGGGLPVQHRQSSPDESGISDDERRELIAQIEGLFTEKHTISTKTSEKHRRGIAFPIYVNLSAAAILVAALLVVATLSQRRLLQVETGGREYLTTEGLVVEKVKQQAAADLSASEARIAQIKSELENLRQSATGAMSGTNADRQRRLERELTDLQSWTTDRLAALAHQRELQTFLIRQLQGIYQNIGRDISKGDLGAAIAGLASADRLLEDKGLAGTEIATVAPALSADNAALGVALQYGQTAMQAAFASDVTRETASIAKLVQQGDYSYAAGNLAEAQLSYTKAIDTLDDVSRAYSRLTAMSDEKVGKQVDDLVAQIDRLKNDVERLQASIATERATVADQRSQIARQNTRIAELTANLTDATRSVQKRTEELFAVVLAMQKSVAPGALTTDSTTAPGSSELLSLLKTKVEIRSAVRSADTKKAYPGLESKIDDFFKRYADAYASRGRAAALKQVAAALDDVIVSMNLNLQQIDSAPRSAPAGVLEQKPSGESLVSLGPIDSYLFQVDGLFKRLTARPY